ncbi:MAG: hypothetical protein EAZ58_12155, partial [Flavobacterium sp.]
ATGFIGELAQKGQEAVSGGVDGATQQGGNLFDSASGLVGDLLNKGQEAVSGGVDAAQSVGQEIQDSAANPFNADSES